MKYKTVLFAHAADLVDIEERFCIAAKEAIRANIITIVEIPLL